MNELLKCRLRGCHSFFSTKSEREVHEGRCKVASAKLRAGVRERRHRAKGHRGRVPPIGLIRKKHRPGGGFYSDKGKRYTDPGPFDLAYLVRRFMS